MIVILVEIKICQPHPLNDNQQYRKNSNYKFLYPEAKSVNLIPLLSRNKLYFRMNEQDDD